MKSSIQPLVTHWKKIAIIAVITAIASIVFGYGYLQHKYETTLFLSIGSITDGNSILDNVEAADHFAETVQGWFKNPAFLKQVNKLSGIDAGLSARKQEKQNLIVTYKTLNDDDGKYIATAVNTSVEMEIKKYNQTTKSSFTLALFSSDTKELGDRTLFLAVFGLLIGLALGIALSFAYESLFR